MSVPGAAVAGLARRFSLTSTGNGGQKGLANLGEVLMHIVIACGAADSVIKGQVHWT